MDVSTKNVTCLGWTNLTRGGQLQKVVSAVQAAPGLSRRSGAGADGAARDVWALYTRHAALEPTVEEKEAAILKKEAAKTKEKDKRDKKKEEETAAKDAEAEAAANGPAAEAPGTLPPTATN